MDLDESARAALEGGEYRAAMQWKLQSSSRPEGNVHIQAGTLPRGIWYVRHTGFGTRGFPDKRSARQAIRTLMERHTGSWEQTALDAEPFLAVCPADGSRVLYDADDDVCLFACWGEMRGELWARFEAAFAAGRTLRKTEGHPLFGGWTELIEYQDPLDGGQRYAVVMCRSEGDDYRVVDYPRQRAAGARYTASVRENEVDEFPYNSSDVRGVSVDSLNRLPEGLSYMPDGSVGATEDVEYLYAYAYPPRVRWPLTTDPALVSGPVQGMTAEPRGWHPVEATIHDATPAGWHEPDPDLVPNALALASLPDGRQQLASAHDGAAHVWSVRDGANLATVTGHDERVLSVAMTVLCTGEVVLATGGQDGLVRAWSVPEGKPLQEIKAHRRPANGVAWACPPGTVPWLVTGGDDATVRVWDVEDRQELAVFEVGEESIEIVCSVAAAVLADGQVCVAATSLDWGRNIVHVWNATTRTKLHEFAIEGGGFGSGVALATLADRSFRVAAFADRIVQVWDGHTGREVRTLTAPEGPLRDIAMAVAPDLRVAVAATGGRTTTVWDAESGAVLAAVDHADDGFHCAVDLATRPDGGLLLAAGRANRTPACIYRLDVQW